MRPSTHVAFSFHRPSLMVLVAAPQRDVSPCNDVPRCGPGSRHLESIVRQLGGTIVLRPSRRVDAEMRTNKNMSSSKRKHVNTRATKARKTTMAVALVTPRRRSKLRAPRGSSLPCRSGPAALWRRRRRGFEMIDGRLTNRKVSARRPTSWCSSSIRETGCFDV